MLAEYGDGWVQRYTARSCDLAEVAAERGRRIMQHNWNMIAENMPV